MVKSKVDRNSNLELYRVIVMLLIVAHHYFVNSGIVEAAAACPDSFKSIYVFLFGMWGKTGINCFVLITGYFMCTSSITLQKFLKLIFEVYIYRIVIFIAFLIVGYESISMESIVRLVVPVLNVSDNFTGCFILFWLTIPFLNVLINNLSQKQHLLMVILAVLIYTVIPLIPYNRVLLNYVSWFIVLYFIASYIRIYKIKILPYKAWGWLTVLLMLTSMASVVCFLKVDVNPYLLVSDSNSIFALAVGICSFMFFKEVSISRNRFINALGASTFGVLLIHANSDAMRMWLWQKILNNVGMFENTLLMVVMHSIVSVLAVYVVCTLIDWLRIRFIERPFFSHFGAKIDRIQSIIFV